VHKNASLGLCPRPRQRQCLWKPPAAAQVAISAVCLLALALRLGLYARYPGFAHPDETFQYIEPAHRIVYGVGAIPWEYQVGMRNWVVPGILAGVIEVSRLFGETPWIERWAIVIAMSLVSLVPVLCAALWGNRHAGLPGAVLAGGVVAVWFETVFFGPHALADTFGAALLAAGLWLGDPATPAPHRRRIFWAGVVLGMTAVVRIQLGPALAIAGLALCRLQLRARWLPFLAGAAIPVLLLGLLDRVTWGGWFQSVRLYVWVNQGLDLASSFGVEPWYFYPGWMLLNWIWAVPLLLLTAVVGAWRLPVLAACFVVTVLSFSQIAHKEERFVQPVMPLLLTLAGVGTARLLAPLLRRARLRAPTVALALCGWGVISLSLGRRDLFEGQLLFGTGMVRVMDDAAADASVCGLAMLPLNNDADAARRLQRHSVAAGYDFGRRPLQSRRLPRQRAGGVSLA